jgi:hypothetical protein
MGKPAVIVDRSMMTDKERAADRALGNPEAGETNTSTGDKGLEDTTDLENEDFTFLY